MVIKWKANIIPYLIRTALVSCCTLLFFYIIANSFQSIDFVFRGWSVESKASITICLFMGAILFGLKVAFPLSSESKYMKVKKWISERVPVDIQLLFVVIVGILLFSYIVLVMQGNGIHVSRREWINDIVMYISAFFLTFGLLCMIGEYGRVGIKVFTDQAVFRQIHHELWLCKMVYMLRDALKQSTPTERKVIKTLMVWCIAQMVLLLVAFVVEELRLPILLVIVACSVMLIDRIIRLICSLQGLTQAASAMVAGHMDVQLPQSPRGILEQLTLHMNSMKQGIKDTVEQKVKSERMKSELITHVSHDLKTPLTSLRSYVDLLKRNKGTAEEQAGYVEVLERKTKRLHVLVEDLFEAAKMASGDVELHVERVDVAALLHQALAEYNEAIAQSNLTFRVNAEGSLYAQLDGKRVWRVFDNLIGNAIKYSMEQSRVFISLTHGEEYLILSIKNVSAIEMNFTADEVVERFKRGDASRTTEGSGLGLSIAKSIVDLHEGHMDVEMDGDLFKVQVRLPKKRRLVIQEDQPL